MAEDRRSARREFLARMWLDGHGAHDREVSPLLLARLDARRRGETLGRVAVGVAIFLLIFSSISDDGLGDGAVPVTRILAFGITGALIAVAAQ